MKDLVEKYENEIEDNPEVENSLKCDPIEVENAMKDFDAIVNQTSVVDVEDIINKLNPDQKRVFDKVDKILSSNKDVMRMMVSGEGGTGKSVLIQTIKEHVKKKYEMHTAVTALTGLSAINVSGLTIYRLLQLPVALNGTAKYKQLSDAALKILRENLKMFFLSSLMKFQ